MYKRLENEEWTFRVSAVCSHLYRRELWKRYDVKFQSGERGEDMPISLFFAAVCPRINYLAGMRVLLCAARIVSDSQFQRFGKILSSV